MDENGNLHYQVEPTQQEPLGSLPEDAEDAGDAEDGEDAGDGGDGERKS